MEAKRFSSSVLLSIFKRKGGEGLFTKVVNEQNKLSYIEQTALLEKDESALFCYKVDESNWVMITDSKIIQKKGGEKLFIPFLELLDVDIALQEEFVDRILNKEDFSRLILKDQKGIKHIIKLEKGQSFQGIFQVLHYLVNKDKFR